MAQYQYVNNKGVMSTIEAPTAQAALKAPDIGVGSGVMLVKTPASTASTPSNPIPTPSNSGTSASPAGNLLDFKSALNQVVQKAKEERNKLSLDFMKPFQGTVAASDFGSILGNLNQATDTFATDTLKEAAKSATPTFKTEQIGNDLYQYQVDVTGKIIGEPTKVLSGKSTTETTKDNETAAQKKIATLFDTTKRDPEGYPLPEEYRNLRAAWVADGHDGSNFDKIFSGYVNPKTAKDYGVNFQTKISSNAGTAWQDELLKALDQQQ